VNIHFAHDKPGIYTLNKTVAFPAIVNGKNINCEIAEEALLQHFGAHPPEGTSKPAYDAAMIAAFEAARERIEAVAAKHIKQNPAGLCLLGPEHF
jgi:hypothetical protein